MWMLDYFAVCRTSTPISDQIVPGALFSEASRADRVARSMGGSVLPMRLVLDTWSESRHEIHTMTIRLRPDGAPVADPAKWTSDVRFVEAEVDQARVSTYLAAPNKWAAPTALTVEGPSIEACRLAAIHRLESEPYHPPPRPNHWGPGDDMPPDLSRLHWVMPDGSVQDAPPRTTPEDPPRPSAPPPAPSNPVPEPPASRPPDPSKRTQIVEHAMRNGLDAMICPTCDTVCVLGAQREPREYLVQDFGRDDHSLGATHDHEACNAVLRRRSTDASTP